MDWRIPCQIFRRLGYQCANTSASPNLWLPRLYPMPMLLTSSLSCVLPRKAAMTSPIWSRGDRTTGGSFFLAGWILMPRLRRLLRFRKAIDLFGVTIGSIKRFTRGQGSSKVVSQIGDATSILGLGR